MVMSRLQWSEVSYERSGKVLGDIARLVPEMNLREVDETREWMRENWKGLRHGRKMLWGRLKRREEELLGRKPGSGVIGDGTVVTLSAEQAALLDEVRRLRKENAELRGVTHT